MSNNSLRTIAGNCLIFSIPSVVLSGNVRDGLILGLVSVALLMLLSPLKMDTEEGLATACLLSVTAATLLNVFPAVGLAETPTSTLLIVFNGALLGRLLKAQSVIERMKQSLRTGVCFLALLASLLGVKAVFGRAGAESPLPPSWQLVLLLYPGGVILVVGLLYLLLHEREIEAES